MSEDVRSEEFLKLYRVLEGILEKRYVDKKISSGSVVMEYLRDADSQPWRPELDMCREIRNLLSHNTDTNGQSVVEPSAAVVEMLQQIVRYVQRPRLAIDYATPQESILFAHPNDIALDILRHMQRMGYSHVPVRDKNRLVGVFSAGSLLSYTAIAGFDRLQNNLRIGEMRRSIEFGADRSEKYLFLPRDVMLMTVREAFDKRRERNSHLAAVFITQDGTQQSEVLGMLTPWDVIKDN